MRCDELLPSYVLYAAGRADEPELSEIRAHLARGCEDCTAGVRAARAFAYSIGSSSEGQEPSAELRARVLAIPDTVAQQPGRQAANIGDRKRPDLALVAKPRPSFWFRPMPVWLGSAVAAACLAVALIPGFVWRRELSDSTAAQSAAAAMLAREQRSEASLRDQMAKLERTGSNRSQGVPIFALELVRGAGAADSTHLTIPRGADAIVLALPNDLIQRATAAELRNASDQSIWTASPVLGGTSEAVGLTIPTSLLSTGRYSVVLRTGERSIARLPFLVTVQK